MKFLKDGNLEIDFAKGRPDFIIKNKQNILIEAVVSEIRQDGIKENDRTLDDILNSITANYSLNNFEEIMNEAITRYSNAILSKTNKYKQEYSKCEWVKADFPFIIALASYSQINYGREYIYPIVALLYGYYYNPISYNYSELKEITKPGKSAKIPLGIFNNYEMEDISGIIFTCTLTLGKLTALALSENKYINLNTVFNIRLDNEEPIFKVQEIDQTNPENLTDGLFVFHNPNAKNKIPEDFLSYGNITHVKLINNEIIIENNNSILFSRLNIPKAFLPEKLKDSFINNIFESFNPRYKCGNFQIVDIDIDLYKEITLLDLLNGMYVICDVDEKLIDIIYKEKISENDKIYAEIFSPNTFSETTNFWRILSIKK